MKTGWVGLGCSTHWCKLGLEAGCAGQAVVSDGNSQEGEVKHSGLGQSNYSDVQDIWLGAGLLGS